MGMKEVTGDLIRLFQDGQFDVIVHGCNCFCTMGAGIAKTIKQKFPVAYEADLATPRASREKLGTYSRARVSLKGKDGIILNAYTQFDWRGSGVKVDYDAVSAVFVRIAEDFPAARIGYPLIGAGLAGGDWSRIARIIDDALEGMDHTLVRFETRP
jgi:O-acetyl-ADP-ribose deacetylase (regulator of RNase III)